jgi:regulator of nucleoside diphosphate kinase
VVQLKDIVVTETDRSRLTDMLESLRTYSVPYRGQLDALEQEVKGAAAVAADQVSAEVVTMNSRVVARDLDSGETVTFTLVYHGQEGLSVLSPLGIELLGSRVGDVIEWPMRRGARRLKIERLLYQPEAAGNFEL